MSDARDEDYVAHFQARSLQDALASAHRGQLLERAERFEAAKHRPGIDFAGAASMDDLREQWCRCDERARALRAAAELVAP